MTANLNAVTLLTHKPLPLPLALPPRFDFRAPLSKGRGVSLPIVTAGQSPDGARAAHPPGRWSGLARSSTLLASADDRPVAVCGNAIANLVEPADHEQEDAHDRTNAVRGLAMNAPVERSLALEMLAVEERSTNRQTASPVNAPRLVGHCILVGHSCPLVEMGLLATLSRRTLYGAFTFDELAATPKENLGERRIDVIIADRAIAGRLAGFASEMHRSKDGAAPKILLIGGDALAASGVPATQAAYDACLPVECRQDDLIDTVNALIGLGAVEGSMRSARAITQIPAANDATLESPVAKKGIPALEGFDLNIGKSRPRGGLPPGALRRVRETMEQRLDEKLELTELAAVAGVSRSHFVRAFKESMGQSPHRYLMARRVAVAADLVKDTDRRLTDISTETGFFDQSHFVRIFRSIVGETPGSYRRRHR